MTEGDSEEGVGHIADAEATTGDNFKPYLEGSCSIEVREAPGSSLTTYSIARDKIEPQVKKGTGSSELERFVLIGFDVEYQSLKPYYSQADITSKKALNKVLSYQIFAKIDGAVFREIVIPTKRRLSFVELITFALAKITASGHTIPRTCTMVGHFNKADLSAFDDREQVFAKLTAIRNSLVTHSYPIKIRIMFGGEDDNYEEVKIHVRDSILMAPASHRSLDSVGKLIGMRKIKLHDDPKVELELKRNISVVRDNDWELFREYAILDAEISALYFERLTALYREITGSSSIPTALSNIGVKLLISQWEHQGINRLQVIGRERINEEVWNNDTGSFITYKEEPYIADVHWSVPFATECYHGGRAEQMWFGPSEIRDFSDYDLAGAYPTAMATLKAPNWASVRETKDKDDLRLCKFGFAWVRFKFPDTVRWPTLPVRTTRGLVFPLEGECYCCSPEIELAISLGAEITIKRALVIDTSEQLVFEPFIKKAIKLRNEATNDVEKGFWKEVGNACYGKMAQGLKEKRAFNLKTKKTKPFPESPITNPFFAAYVTSLVRAVIGEIINDIPRERTIFSVTTDGFLTDADEEEIRSATSGPIAKMFSEARGRLTGSLEVLTKKHSVKRLLGSRTRGQSTLIGDPSAGDKGIVLAKAGIKTPPYLTKVAEQNDYIVESFLQRKPGQRFVVDSLTTLRDIMLFQADVVTKRSERAIGMEYDLKRRPAKVQDSAIEFKGKSYNHVAFSTEPWRTEAEFMTARQLWESHSYHKVKIEVEVKDKKTGRTKKITKLVRRQRYCLKTASDFKTFASFYDTKIAMKGKNQQYIRSDVSRLRLVLCTAYQHGAAGLAGCRLRYTAQEFVDILNNCEFDELVTRQHVEYGVRRKFKFHTVPPTEKVNDILVKLSELIPSLRGADLITSKKDLQLLSTAIDPQ